MSRHGWILILVVPAALHARARAADETETMLLRARDGRVPSRRDRDIARDLLGEWRESERIAPGTGDPALGRTLEAVAAGRRLDPDKAAVAGRLAAGYRVAKAEAAVRPTGGAASQGTRSPGSRLRRMRPRNSALLALGGTGVAVVVIGAAWIVARQRFRRR